MDSSATIPVADLGSPSIKTISPKVWELFRTATNFFLNNLDRAFNNYTKDSFFYNKFIQFCK